VRSPLRRGSSVGTSSENEEKEGDDGDEEVEEGAEVETNTKEKVNKEVGKEEDKKSVGERKDAVSKEERGDQAISGEVSDEGSDDDVTGPVIVRSPFRGNSEYGSPKRSASFLIKGVARTSSGEAVRFGRPSISPKPSSQMLSSHSSKHALSPSSPSPSSTQSKTPYEEVLPSAISPPRPPAKGDDRSANGAAKLGGGDTKSAVEVASEIEAGVNAVKEAATIIGAPTASLEITKAAAAKRIEAPAPETAADVNIKAEEGDGDERGEVDDGNGAAYTGKKSKKLKKKKSKKKK
jgi:hypothetical protein